MLKIHGGIKDMKTTDTVINWNNPIMMQFKDMVRRGNNDKKIIKRATEYWIQVSNNNGFEASK